MTDTNKKQGNTYRRRYARLRGRLKAWRRTKVGLADVPTPLLLPFAEVDDLCCTLAERLEADPDNATLLGHYLTAIRARQDYLKMLTQLTAREEPSAG